ncbi:MAG: sigma-54-dependent Fis family transcriptional regulator [Deltaproteobacteria bacterium]|nr:sigma-54-dependent Fis family transcriptional regulator [Deltaproteobacteria bacterium]
MEAAAADRQLVESLSDAKPGKLGKRMMELALDRTGAHHGALFLWDDAAEGLVLDTHLVDGMTVTLPNRVISRGSKGAGVALWTYEQDQPYLVKDTLEDPHYTRYLVDVRSIAAAPIRYQGRPIGVLSVSSRRVSAFDDSALERLQEVADASASFVRRAQLDLQSRKATGRPFLIRGLSDAWSEVENRLELASPTNAPILIRGESGTGKDLVARAVHFNSKRAGGAYVTVNCAAIPETLLESTLFGHKKGAFTGASFDKVGEFSKANGGTLFLDEVGELPLALQAKVLRAVEQGEVQPLGSNKPPEQVDVRLICATNRDIESMAKRGEFRDDLYYRLSVMTMELPPLRSYKDNLEVLAGVFLEQAARHHDRRAPRIGPAAMTLLMEYQYPGNVRELKNSIEHAVILCAGDEIQPGHLPRALRGEDGPLPSQEPTRKRRPLKELREEWLRPLERRYLVELLRENQGNVRQAAEIAGVNHVTLYRLLKKHGIAIERKVSESSEKN